jgi:hypothetical protein
MHFHMVGVYGDREVEEGVKNVFLSVCDVRVFLTFASPGVVLLWQLFCLFCSCN